MLKRLTQVMTEFAGFQPQWRALSSDVPLQNPGFGRVDHVVVCDPSGKPRYDQPIWSEKVGAVCIPVDVNGHVYLIRQQRWAVAQAGTEFDPLVDDVSRLGATSWELPRGFPNAGETAIEVARRETIEETGLQPISAEVIDYVNLNTTYCPNAHAVVLLDVAPRTGSSLVDYRSPEATELVESVGRYSLPEIMSSIHSGSLVCGVTKAAICSYMAWLACNKQSPHSQLRAALGFAD